MDMNKILIFAGTSEGREITEFLSGNGAAVYVCVATPYGKELLPENKLVTVSDERLDKAQMCALIKELAPPFVIDATHPYAAEVTENIKSACARENTEYIRLVRGSFEASGADIIYADSVADAVSKLEGTEGNILAATGSRDLKEYTKLEGYKERVFARVLSTPEVVSACADLGFEGKNLICMQGPFSKEMNMALLRQFGCRYMVTKESGTPGGFEEKYEAARECGTCLVVVGRPAAEKGPGLKELKAMLCRRLELRPRQKITLAGTGMGSLSNMTKEVYDAYYGCDLLIGAQRMVKYARPGQDVFTEYKAEKIAQYIQDHPEYENITIALSGDAGFYSGAKKLLEVLPEGIEILPGISSLSYFAAKTGISWEDAVPVSLHGQNMNIVGLLKEHEKVFAIVGDKDTVGDICQKLSDYGMGDTTVYIGERLSYADESINCASANAFAGCETDPLSVVLFIRRNFEKPIVTYGIPDSMFIRGSVPMTKEEIREIVLSKLRLKKNSVMYDIGSGTGSISIESALVAGEGKIYSIEKNKEAVEFLLKQNKVKFACDNLEIIHGKAPEALEDLPAPTHAFIGGSSRNLKEILSLLIRKNPEVRIVMTCITLETVTQALECINEMQLEEFDFVQISAAKAKPAGKYHLMTAANPVYVITCSGKTESPGYRISGYEV